MMAVAFAALAAVCFGAGMVTARIGLRSIDARSGAAISVPTAAVFFAVVSLVWLDLSGFDARAALVFALVGLFFPAAVTLVIFASAERIGPALTSSISGTTPLFALVAAFVLLGEAIPARAVLAAAGVVAGVWLMSVRRRGLVSSAFGWWLLLPAAAAAIRAVAQVLAKGGLALWPSPLAASLIGYCASASVLLLADRLRSNRRRERPDRSSALIFMATGLLNGLGAMLGYAALQRAPVALVVPIVSAYPLVTLALSAALLREESVDARVAAGALITLAAVVYLVAG
jgi:drug/metabolite transporter (DMT)-like permease